MHLRFRFFFLITILPILLSAQSGYVNDFKWSESIEIPPGDGQQKQHGLASAFAGRSGDVLIVAGGCNFPNVPVANGGAKKYYSDVFVFREKNGNPKWFSGAKIPNETAYGASVSVPNGLMCIGGNNNDETFKSVYVLTWNKQKSEIELENYPELPFPVTQMGAALLDNIVFVVGGKSDSKLLNTILALDLSKKGTSEFRWEKLKAFPGSARLQPVVVAQNDAEEKHLYVFSGSSFPNNQNTPDVTTDGLEFNPKTSEWNEIAEIKPKGYESFSLHGASGLPLGMNHILFVGGVNQHLFSEAWKKEREGEIASEKGDTSKTNQFKIWKRE
jgi:sialate O-acetylesterase